jgi:hypothetical protein
MAPERDVILRFLLVHWSKFQLHIHQLQGRAEMSRV